MRTCLSRIVGPLAGLLFFANLSAAQDAVNAPTATEEVANSDLKEPTDPTILTRRVWFETEWNKFRDGSSVFEETLGTLWAWRVSADQDFAVRLKVPFKFRVGSDDPAISDIGGFGDMKIAAGTAIRLAKDFRIGGGLDLEMPTGRHELSDNFWRIQEFVALAWDITPWLTFSPSAEYNQSFAEEGSTQPAHFLESFIPFTFILPQKWAIAVGYENKVDFENDNYVTNRAKVLVAKELENVPLSFVLSAKRDFDSGEKEFQVNFAITYFFR